MDTMRQPRRLKQRPQYKGMAIPYIAFMGEDGKPDFRVTDEGKRRSVMQNRQCQLCGDLLGKWVFFVGGTQAAKMNAYFEPACHLDCLIYAMQVCPFIVGKTDHAPIEQIQKRHKDELAHVGVGGLIIKTDDTFAAVRNPYWVIKKATDWTYVRSPDGTILMQPFVVKETKPLHPQSMTAEDWADVFDLLVR